MNHRPPHRQRMAVRAIVFHVSPVEWKTVQYVVRGRKCTARNEANAWPSLGSLPHVA